MGSFCFLGLSLSDHGSGLVGWWVGIHMDKECMDWAGKGDSSTKFSEIDMTAVSSQSLEGLIL
jgi:hypothetical protein